MGSNNHFQSLVALESTALSKTAYEDFITSSVTSADNFLVGSHYSISCLSVNLSDVEEISAKTVSLVSPHITTSDRFTLAESLEISDDVFLISTGENVN